MSKLHTFAVADPNIIDAPWDTHKYAVATFAVVVDEADELTYLGYMVAHAGHGFSPEMVFCLRPGEPLVYGPLHSELDSGDADFPEHANLYKEYGAIEYHSYFSSAEKLLLHILISNLYDTWIVPDRRGLFGAFNLNRLPEMEMGDYEGVPVYSYLDNEAWYELYEPFCQAGLPFWTNWLPDVAVQVDAAIDAQLAEAGL